MNPFSRAIINGVLDRGRSLPNRYRLFYSRTPNNWLDTGWEGDFGWDSELSTWSIPRTAVDWTGATRDMFTILGDGLFFDSAGNPLSVTGTQILAWAGINQYHILFSLTKGLVVYDPYAVTDAVIVKADKFMRQPAYSDIPTIFFNGCNTTGSSAFDSGVLGTNPGQWGPDYLGNLVNAGVDVPAMQGMRLEWVAGPELVVNSNFDTDGITTPWVAHTLGYVALTVMGGVCRVTRITGSPVSGAVQVLAGLTPGKLFKLAGRIRKVSGEGAVSLNIITNDQSAFVLNNSVSGAVTSSEFVNLEYTFTATQINNKIYVRGSELTTVCEFDDISVKEVIPTWKDTKLDGTPILPSTLQPTRTFDAGFVTSTPGLTFPRYIRANPATDMPGYLSEPARSTFAKLPAAPATQTTASLALGTYCLWVEGTGSFQASAGTAAATGGFGAAAVAGSPVTFTITTAGTVVLTKTGTVTWVQLEFGTFPTSRIDNPSSVSSVTRAGTVLSYPTLGKIRPNNQAYRMVVVPRATGQSGAYIYGTYNDASNYTAVIIGPTVITYRKRIAGVNTDATVSIIHTNNVPIQIAIVGTSSTGMRIAALQFVGGVWSAWNNGTLVDSASGKANCIVGTTYQLGSLNNVGQFTGNISELETLDIPLGITDPLAWAKAQWGLPA